MTEALLGGCLCGAIRYRLTQEPIAFYACHCTDCQRQTGAAFGLSMIVRREAVELLQGDPRTFHVRLPDGREKRGRFCDACATRLWGEPTKAPAVRVLRPGTLDDPGAYAPFGDIWTGSARPWATFTGGPRFEGQPEDPLAVVRAWQGRPRI
jgi:hypothetical protein